MKFQSVLVLFQASQVSAAMISAGRYHSVYVNDDGQVFSAGEGGNGELGRGSTTDSKLFVETNITNVAHASAHLASHTMFIKADGQLWGVGDAYYYTLLPGSQTDWTEPAFIRDDVKDVGPSRYNSLYVLKNGTVHGSGYLAEIMMGTTYDPGRRRSKRPFVTANITESVVAAAAGYYHCLFLSSDGVVRAAGSNDEGRLGDNTTTDTTNYPVVASAVSGNVTAVAAGGLFSLFLLSTGEVKGVGGNAYGVLGDNSTTNRQTVVSIVGSGVQAISAGNVHALFLLTNGSVMGTGESVTGALCTNSSSKVPIEVIASGVQAVSAGRAFSLFLMTDGTVQGCGQNGQGQLGDNSTTNRMSPVTATTPTPAPTPPTPAPTATPTPAPTAAPTPAPTPSSTPAAPTSPPPTPSPTPAPAYVTGELELSVTDPIAFVNNNGTAGVLKKVISNVTGASESSISVSYEVKNSSRRLEDRAVEEAPAARSLQDRRELSGTQTVQVDYNITVDSASVATSMETTLQGVSVASLTVVLQAEVVAAGGFGNVTVAVASSTITSDHPAPTPAPAGGSSSGSGGSTGGNTSGGNTSNSSSPAPPPPLTSDAFASPIGIFGIVCSAALFFPW